MDIRQLKLFTHLAATLHFGRTSSHCNISPSALTRTIQRLESECGHQLFIRDNRSVCLTPAGRLFKEYADETLQRWDTLQLQLASKNSLKGSLSLYCSVTAAQSILPGVLQTFRTSYPGVQINLQTGDAARALATLQSNETDVTIAALPESLPPGILYIEILQTDLVCIAPLHFPETLVTTNSGINWQETPIILAEQGLSRVRIDHWFASHGLVPNIYAQVAGNEAIIAMVSLGCGIGIVPQLVLEKSPIKEQIRVLDSGPRLTPFTIGVCTTSRQVRHPIVQAFWATVEGKQLEADSVG